MIQNLKNMIANLSLPDFIVACILALGVLQGLFIGGIFLIKRTGNQKANTFFGGLLIVFSLALLNNLLFHTHFYEQHQQFWLLPIWLTLSFGPLLFYYVKFTLFPTYKLRRSDSKHFILPIWQLSFYLSIALQSSEFKMRIWTKFIQPYYGVVEGGLFLISFFGYLLLAYRYVRYKQQILEKRGYKWELKKVNWIRRVLKMLLVLTCINAVYVLANFASYQFFQINLYANPVFTWSINLTFAAMLYWLGFTAFNHQFLLLSNNQEYQNAIRNKQKDYRTSPEILQLLTRQVQEKMRQEKLYRDPDLKLARLSQYTAIDVNALKFVLKHGLEQSFTAFVNSYRIAEAKERLGNPDFAEATLEEIALKVGFHNTSKFIKTFEKETNTPPQIFREMIK